MKRFPTGFTCLTNHKYAQWFTVGKSYTPTYKDDGVFIPDDNDDFVWKLTKIDGVWMIEIENHTPRIIATFKENHETIRSVRTSE